MLFILLSSTFPWLPLLSLPPSVAFPLAPLSSQLLLLCCKIQLPNWFNFLPFRTLLTYFPRRHSSSLSLPLSRSLSWLPPLFLSCLSSRPRWAADNWMIWIFILNLLPYTELVPRSSLLCFSLLFPRLHFRTVPTRLFIFFSPTIFHCYFCLLFLLCRYFFLLKWKLLANWKIAYQLDRGFNMLQGSNGAANWTW